MAASVGPSNGSGELEVVKRGLGNKTSQYTIAMTSVGMCRFGTIWDELSCIRCKNAMSEDSHKILHIIRLSG